MAKEKCPHCGSRMMWITQVDRSGNVVRRKICSNAGVCQRLREMKKRTEEAKAA